MYTRYNYIVAGFRGMHKSLANHIYIYAWPPRKCDYRTDTQTDRQMPDKVIPMCSYASQATQSTIKVTFYVNFYVKSFKLAIHII